VRLLYFVGIASAPLPSLGGSRTRYRPIMAVRVTGPKKDSLRDCLLDTGSDDTVFDTSLAIHLGIDLSKTQRGIVTLAGRGAVQCSYSPVTLLITDGRSETYEWTAVVGFGPIAFRYSLIGHAGFLQFFNTEFRGHDREVILTTNPSFPGRRL
jgi:hypothetical protein